MPCIKNKSGRGFIMAIFKKQEKKNTKEEKDLQTAKNAGKVTLDDELLGAVAGGTFSPPNIGGSPPNIGGDVVGTDLLKNF